MKPHPHDTSRAALRSFGLGLPGTETKSPWPEHLDLVVSGKTFVFMNVDGVSLRLSCKLPSSASMALALPFCSPTPYGLGRSGWVTAVFTDKEKPPVSLLTEWILESYKAQAPKRLAKALAEKSGVEAPPPQKARPRVPKTSEKKVSTRETPGAASAKGPKPAPLPQARATSQASSARAGSKKVAQKPMTQKPRRSA